MKLLVIGKKGRFVNNSDSKDLPLCEIVYASPDADTAEILAAGRDADAILVDAMSAVPGDAIRQMPNLKLIHSEGVGYQYVDVAAATEKGIYVCNCKGANAAAVAEHAMMLMLSCLRDLVNGNQAVLKANQIQVKENYMLHGSLRELSDCTIGILGFGDIGKAVARMASVFGAKVIFWNIVPVDPEECYGAESVSLDTLLAESDIVSLHVALVPDTTRMADAAFFSKMKEGAYLINTARGEIVDSQALIDALASGHLAGAGLDCIEAEPVKPGNIFLGAPADVQKKIIFSPHIAGITGSFFKRANRMVWENLHLIAEGKTPVRIVNPQVIR